MVVGGCAHEVGVGVNGRARTGAVLERAGWPWAMSFGRE